MTASDAAPHEAGHEWLYRVAALTETPESKYYLTAYEARAWRDRLRQLGHNVHVDRAPASAFTPIADAELDQLATDATADPAQR
ncbi:hypothetical protein AB0D62_38740 [Streptomyces massasporeus]|uniref:hypothetical protein n=1 Tax=Streptomyces massasporeus TaxID=67324 RepID=UPI0033D953F7